MTMLIAGIIRLDDRPASPDCLAAMLRAMHPIRGKVVESSHAKGRAAFGALRLAPAGAPTEPEPVPIVARGDEMMVADARLYGAFTEEPSAALWQQLTTEGPKGCASLHGDFAAATWDGEALLLIRDHVGVRPLQYTVREGAYIAFASLPAALIDTGLAEPGLDADVLETWGLSYGAPGERTPVKQIRSVLPAHWVRMGKAGRETGRYWRQSLGRYLSHRTPAREVADEMRRLVDQAVRRRLPPTGPGAAHISGGIDSTSVAVLAARALAETDRALHGYCLREDPEEGLRWVDESQHAELVAAQEPNITLKGFGTRDWLTLYSETALHPATLQCIHPDEAEERILGDVADHGVGVLLSGWIGDQVASWRGITNSHELVRTLDLALLPRALARESARSGRSRARVLLGALYRAINPPPMLGRPGPRQIATARAILGDILRVSDAAIERVADEAPSRDTRAQRRGRLEHWWIEKQLEIFAQKGARYGISYAFPLADRDLIDFAIQIPGRFYETETHNRAIYRHAMAGVLPDRVRLSINKLMPWPCEDLRVARMKDSIALLIESCRDDPLVERFIDLDRMSEVVEALPDASTIHAEIEAAADRGKEHSAKRVELFTPLWLISALRAGVVAADD